MTLKSDELYSGLIESFEPILAPYNVSPGSCSVTILFHLQGTHIRSQFFGILPELTVHPIYIYANDLGLLEISIEIRFYTDAAMIQFVQRYPVRWKPTKISRLRDVFKFVFTDSEPIFIELPAVEPAEIHAIEASNRKVEFLVSPQRVRLRLYYRGQLDRLPDHLLRRRALLARRGVDRTRPAKANRKGLPQSRPSLTPRTAVFNTREFYWIDGTTITNSSSPSTQSLFTRTEARTLTPNFFSLKRSLRPVNPYSMTEVDTFVTLGYQRCVTVGSPPTFEHFWVAPASFFTTAPAPNFSSDASVENKAYSRLVTAAERECFNIAVDLVQFRQVVDLMTSNFKRITKAYSAVRRGNFSVAANELFDNRPPRFRKNGYPSLQKSVATNWLEFQYGWKPLLNDIHEMIQRLHMSYREDLRSARSSASGTSETVTELFGPVNISISGISPYKIGTTAIKRRVHIRYGVKYRHSSQDLSFLSQTGFTNPVNLAWELIPFSFVVDWALPIGPYLERLSAFQGLSFVGGWKTTFVREELTTIISSHGSKIGTGGQVWDISAECRLRRNSVSMTRSVLATFPENPLPTFKNPLSVTHAANALALMSVAFTGDYKVSRYHL